MSAAASPTAALPRPATNTSPQSRSAAYSSDREAARLPHRTHSNSHRSSAGPSSPRRSMSTSQASNTPASHSRQPSGNLEKVSRHDYEQSNVAQPHAPPSSSSRRSDSHEPAMNGTGAHPQRTDSLRAPSSHARTSSRYHDQPTPAPSGGSDVRSGQQPTNLRRRTTLDAASGTWELGKTIGAGSMGKVKLARNKETGEQVAVKIVPRNSQGEEHRSQAERERAEHSKEVRTAREAAIVTLVDHPYICGMRDVVHTNYHWYMLFEYVNGGQMLDYIISHGRLKEKQARKFGRQIASALDYCHRNSIVHRDLKIENILISKTGDIKIIDFGLSNLFSPKSTLKTFCGSLYFAAPELLQAKQYTGPEVDVWSFGIVLYVLVCGKVPFDDQSMPQLHAKIKKGFVEYPPWLSNECRGLIARMLTTNPLERASLQEIMTHPWMTKGFNGPPENYLPERKPLMLPLDPVVIDKMTGFDFGTAEHITTQLTKVVESADYQNAIKMQRQRAAAPPPETDQRRGVFNFYKRRSSTTSRDTLNTPSAEAIQVGSDPLNAFHPLISVYHLAQEKIEREAKEKNPGALSMPHVAGEKPLGMVDLPAPAPAHTNASAYEMAGEKPTGGRSRPRARTHGEDEVTQDMRNIHPTATSTSQHPTIVEPEKPPHNRKESVAGGLLRRFSKRERSERPNHPPSSLDRYNSETPRKSFSMRRTRDRSQNREASQTREGVRPETAASKQSDLLVPPGAAAATGDATNEKTPPPSTTPSKRSHGLGRSVSVNSSDIRRRLTKRGASEGSSKRPPLISTGSSENRKVSFDQSSSIREAQSDAEGPAKPTSAFATRARSLGHSRKESMQVRRARREQARNGQADLPEETDAELMDEVDTKNGSGSPNMKPVYLKGLFSVSTTSSKPLNFIRADLIRVLQELGVEYREVKGGFSCKHAPSIVPKTGPEEAAPAPLTPPVDTHHKRKISFGGFRSQQQQSAEAGGEPSKTPRKKPSYTTGASEEDSEEDPPTSHPRASAQQRAAGETSTHVQNDFGEGLALKFEIFVVKVPLLSLHGIQFKKVDGGTWQYKNMAQKILNELRL
ncbi:Protein kinase kin1 [Cercospora beticola]|uniref:non-specific serine/threonine protein kinase n=2 Tax=Cercospora beticola TaxID=122368 RepID=A0A2G5I7C8_CERBT|nr:Protein kinase kin1 [Cercospora beticola]PIB00701.1 Protein kinase kin1 [Cercospora beticola]